MRHAPSVSFPVGRSRFCALSAGCAWLAAAWALAWVAWEGAAGSWRIALGALAWVAAGGLAAHAVLSAPRGRLAWEEGAWSWTGAAGDTYPVLVQPVLDAQGVLLLQVRADPAGQGPPGRQALWLERRDDPASWLALRRAVYSRAAHPAPPAAEAVP